MEDVVSEWLQKRVNVPFWRAQAVESLKLLAVGTCALGVTGAVYVLLMDHVLPYWGC